MTPNLYTLLHQHGFRLLRQRKHEVWGHPDGRRFVCSVSPSDPNAHLAAEKELRKLLGLEVAGHRKPLPAPVHKRKQKRRRGMQIFFPLPTTTHDRERWRTVLQNLLDKF